MRFLTLTIAFLLAGTTVSAQDAGTTPTASFKLAETYTVPAFKPTDLGMATSQLVAGLCATDVSEVCEIANSALIAADQTRLEQVLTAQTVIEQAQFATMIAFAEMQRDDARDLAQISANVLAETTAFGAQTAAEAATARAAEEAKMTQAAADLEVSLGNSVDINELTKARATIVDLTDQVQTLSAAELISPLGQQRREIQEAAVMQITNFLSSMQQTCDDQPTVSWCASIASLPDMQTVLGTN
jgi:hypothetical protein